ncbi:DUF5719 family protein [Cellulomonas sp. URHE0023]|uniref:DUF5719 family protein n=1 Tax=Cellulomonas sp. URHE0023 TaxID=1380354 RepID=UPI0004804FFA|nr:DUF5719 family protein [Cellulomonas sp. URHE0023]
MTDAEVSRSHVWLGRTARAATGLVVLGLTVAVVAAGTRLPDGDDPAVPATRVPVKPSATTLVCPGPLILPDDTGRGDGAFDPTPVDPISTVTAVTSSPSGPGAVLPLDRSTTWATLAADGDAVQLPTVGVPSIVRADPTDVPARVAAVGSGLVTAGDLRGLAAASCQQSTGDAWLLGGATDLSSTAQLVLDNPGTTPAEVALEVWGPNGTVDLTGERYLVAPGAQRVIVLGGIAAEQRRLALHVVATGGRIGVHVQDSALDGFTPGGTELVVPGAMPSTRQVVPGISVVASTVDDPHAPALRLLAPGDAATTATVTLLGPDGVLELPGVDTVALAPGEVTDVPLGGLPAGAYTAVVDSDEPVIASSVMSRPGSLGELDDSPSVERAWAASTAPGRAGLVALPAGTQGTLVLAAVSSAKDVTAGGAATGRLRLLGPGGAVVAERTVSIPAGTTSAWTLDELAAGTGAVAPADPAAVAAPHAGVVGVDLLSDQGAGVTLAWVVVAEAPQADGTLFSVLDPVPVPDTAPDVAVREDPRLGTY